MRGRRLVLVVVSFAFLALTGACGCSKDAEVANTGPADGTSTTTTTQVGDTLPPLTVVPRTTTSIAKPTTTGPKKPVTTIQLKPTTTKPKVTVTTVAANVKQFCDYAKKIGIQISNTDWVSGFNDLHQAIIEAQKIVPQPLAQALADLKAAFDAAQLSVDNGTLTSENDFVEWLGAQLPETQARLKDAFDQLQTYLQHTC